MLPDPFQAVHSQEQPFLHLEWSSFPPVDSNHDTQIQSLMSCLLDEEGIVGWTRRAPSKPETGVPALSVQDLA